MERELFFKKAIDILLSQEFIPGVPLFTIEDIDYYVVGDEGDSMPLSEFLDELYNCIMKGEWQNES